MAREIDENLKRVYQAALTEDVPDRFKALLDALKAKEARTVPGTPDSDKEGA